MIAGARRRGLAFQIGFLTTAVALVTVLVATAVSVALVRSAVTTAADRRLARDADLVASLTPHEPGTARSRRRLIASGVRLAVITKAGAVRGDLAIAPSDISTLLSGQPVSGERTIDGQHLIVEGRPVDAGGAIALAATTGLPASTTQAIRRAELFALLAGLLGGALAGVLLARRVAKPLRATADGARRIAAGERTVRIPARGPEEVAAVTEALNLLSAALAVSEQRQREFLLSVSHELRTPLTAIRGFSEALADGVTTGPEVRPTGATMLAEAERLDRLVADLLDLARLGADDFRIDLVDTDLHALLRAAADVWTGRCATVGVELRTEYPDGPAIIRTDPTRVRQIIDGLTENALRVTPTGQPIVLALTTSPSQICLEVRDGGPGLSDEDLAVAFDRSVLYDRYRGVRQVGTGLGLAIVGALATRLGGHANASHAPEGGARFTIGLPT